MSTKKAASKKMIPKKTENVSGQTRLLSKMSMFFFDRPFFTLLLWLCLLVFGVLSYTSFLKREGFPAIQVPLGIATGTYFVDEPNTIDREIAVPIQQYLEKRAEITDITATARANSFTFVVGFEESVSSAQASSILQEEIEASGILPEEASIDYLALDPGKFLDEYDVVVSVYDKENAMSLAELEASSAAIAERLEQDEAIVEASVESKFATGVNPATGEEESRQDSFGRIGVKEGGEVAFYSSATIGINGDKDLDVIELSKAVNAAIEQELSASEAENNLNISVSADFANSVETQISSLQGNIITGLIAVAVISFMLITWRASIITGIFMVSVMAVTLLVLLLIGYSLNTITLFALVLSLGLFVDDATIIVEAIDASRKEKGRGSDRDAALSAVRRVSAASFAGTLTTVLVFLPLAFVSGILGEFIRIMPITIIIALITSFVLSLTLIPFLSKYLLLVDRSKSKNPITGLQEMVARGLSEFPLTFRDSRISGYVLSFLMIGVSIGFFVAAVFYAGKVEFNIFPPTKDSDELAIDVNIEQGAPIDVVEQRAIEVDTIAKQVIGENLESVFYLSAGQRGASMQINLKPFTEREIKSPEIIDQLNAALVDVEGVSSVKVGQLDAGPPVSDFPFTLQIFGEDYGKSIALATAIEEHLSENQVERPNGTTSEITDTAIGNEIDIVRVDGKRLVEVKAAFDADDISALVTAAQALVEEEFTEERLAEFGFASSDIVFDFGQESENQDSFASMGIVGLLSIGVMYLLLAIQFKSFIQPFLIFMAIPFSMFGVMYGLYITDNPIGFFSMVGFFGLIGIAVNNTILLTDYANQERRKGTPIIESISEATRKRFRPLLTTSLTTVAALLPLALSDPFWEALAFTIIFGLLSSTLLVLVSFPYYYLFVEGMRTRTSAFFRSKFMSKKQA